jgi:septal ring factor EnvC (AmiA/AmiB activator)
MAAIPDKAAPSGREASARRQVEESERVRATQAEAEREATAQAARAAQEEDRLTAAQSTATSRLKRAEAAVTEMTLHMRELEDRRAEAQTRIDKRADVLRPMLPVIIRMSTFPVETLLGAQVPPEDAVRGIAVLRTLARQAEVDATALSEDRTALEAATREAEEMAPRLAAAEIARSYEADVVAGQLAIAKEQRQVAEKAVADTAQRAAAEAARAQSLRSMLQVLETQRRLEEAQAREDVLRAERGQQAMAAESARLRQTALAHPTGTGTLLANAKPSGQLRAPVAGVLVRGWGDPEDGEPATGQSYRTDPGAPVVAPCGGTVAFAEPFRGYGLLVIIDCGGGYHAVLSGLDKIAVGPGLTIRDGDRIGTMEATVKTAAAGEPLSGRPVLYVELRKGGRPVDPAPWLKTNG